MAVVLMAVVGGCTDDKAGLASGSADDDAAGSSSEASTTGEPTGGPSPMEVCERYLDCLAVAAPSELPDAQQGYGPDGTCWQGSPETAEQCLDACRAGLEQLHGALPDEPRCDAASDDGGDDTGDAGDIGGTYLFALSMNIAPLTPFQFIATVETDASGISSLELQPLTLEPGSVTSPRLPFGAPLVFTDIPVVDDSFEIKGTLDLAGPTNPVSGADTTMSVTMPGTITGEGSICGTVEGQVIAPVPVALTGSTFAAVRIESSEMLPVEVVINCGGDTAR